MHDSQQNMNGLQGDILAETSEENHVENPQPQKAFASMAAIAEMDPEKRSNLTLTSILVAGLIIVYLLSMYSGPNETQGATGDAIRMHVDTALQNISNQSAPAIDHAKLPTALEMLDKVFSEILDRQIVLQDLKDNPFVFRVPDPANAPDDTDNRPILSIKALTGLEGLKLESIVLAGDESFAIISGKLLNLNQQINGWKVTQIKPGSVELTRGPDKYEMKMREK